MPYTNTLHWMHRNTAINYIELFYFIEQHLVVFAYFLIFLVKVLKM